MAKNPGLSQNELNMMNSVPTPKDDVIIASNPFDDDPPSTQLRRLPPPPGPQYPGGGPPPQMMRPQMMAYGQLPPGMMQNGPPQPGPGGPGPYWVGPPPGGPGGHPGEMYYYNPGGGQQPMYPPTIPSSNAPPIHPCKLCNNEIREDEHAVQCAAPQGCSYFFHLNCAEISEDAYKLLQAEPYAEWVCDGCFKGKQIEPIQYGPGMGSLGPRPPAIATGVQPL